jgi:Protein of unknown function (DUF2844)
MKRFIQCRLRGVSVVFLIGASALLGSTSSAWASLGGDTVSIIADQSQMQGTRKTSASAAYTVHEIQGATGTIVREYQSADGTVFAISWHGSSKPDMQQVLGSYFEQYKQALQAQHNPHAMRHPITINLPGLQIFSGGHPRSFEGKAFIPEKLPRGIRPEDIQ